MAEIKVQEYYTPADKWLSILNKKYPNIWAEMKKFRETAPFEIRKHAEYACLKDMPQWAEMPTIMPVLVINNTKIQAIVKGAESAFTCDHRHPHYEPSGISVRGMYLEEIMSLSTMYLWRKSKGVYRFSPELYKELTKQAIDNDLHMDSFFQMPEWAVYIETPGMMFYEYELEGFIAHVDYAMNPSKPNDNHIDLQLALFIKGVDQPCMMALPFGEGTVMDAVERMTEIDKQSLRDKAALYQGATVTFKERTLEESLRVYVPMLNLLMYLCSEEPDMERQNQPAGYNYKKEKGSTPKEPRIWDVGARISHVIRKYREEEAKEARESGNGGSGVAKRPHIRSAHWHTYWIGPRKEVFPNRRTIAKWLPLIPVGVNWQDELPVNIKVVD